MTSVFIRKTISDKEDMKQHIGQHTSDYIVMVPVRSGDMQSCNTAPVMEILSVLKSHVDIMHGSINLCFEGYEDDPRAPETIPEIITFYQQLQRDMPELLIFVRHQMPGGDPRFNELRTFTRIAVADHLHLVTDGTNFFGSNDLLSILLPYFEAVDKFYKANNIPAELSRKIHNNILTAYWYLKDAKEL